MSAPLTWLVFAKKSNPAIVVTLLLAVLCWGGSNAGTKYLVAFWSPGWLGTTRLFCAGIILLGILKFTPLLGTLQPLSAKEKWKLWGVPSLSLASYIAVFNWAMRFTTASHVALYLGMSPIWTLLWDSPPRRNLDSARRYFAAMVALSGVVVLFWPALRKGNGHFLGEILGVIASFLWANYGRQCRLLGSQLSGAEISAHTMWRAGLWLAPLAAWEILTKGLIWRTDLVLVQVYCFVIGGVAAYALWNNALKHWPTSQVFLFNNLIPLSTMCWANVCLKEPFTRTFWLATALVMFGVVLGQPIWQKFLGNRWAPAE